MRTARPLALAALVGLAAALPGCAPSAPVTSADGASGPPVPGERATAPAPPLPPGSDGDSQTPLPSERQEGTALGLPSGPATLAPAPPPPAPGSLRAVDWAAFGHAACAGGTTAGDVVGGDLDGDGTEEVAVPVLCADRQGAGGAETAEGAANSVLVYGGDAAEPRLLGDALPAEEAATLYAVQVRDGYLVVTALTSRQAERDTAVTARWRVEAAGLRRTDRWEDPAFVLEVDAAR